MKTEDEIKEQICLLSKELEQNIDNENAIAIYGLGINLLKWVLESEEE